MEVSYCSWPEKPLAGRPPGGLPARTGLALARSPLGGQADTRR